MFNVYCLQVLAEAVTPLALDPYCGSALRGAFFQALWGQFCTNHDSPTCAACPLVQACPVATILAPLREEQVYGFGQHSPCPYVMIPPEIRQDRRGEGTETTDIVSRNGSTYEKGASFCFGIHLIGTSARLFPYVFRALQQMEQVGLGRPLAELKGQRGRFLIREVRLYHPYRGEQQLLWQPGDLRPQRLALCLTPADIAHRADEIGSEMILNFTSPTRLVRAKQVLTRPDIQILLLRLAERFGQLLQAYGEGHDEALSIGGREWYLQIGRQAQAVHLARDETRWLNVMSYSTRQHKRMSVGGFLGRATFQWSRSNGKDREGDGDHMLRELLAWGEVIGVGKSVTKGAGRYAIETPQA